MIISSPFNRLYHKMLGEIAKADYMEVYTIWQGDCFVFKFAPRRVHMDSVKQLFKRLNTDYPCDGEGNTVSTRKIDSRALCEHIIWLHAVALENGIQTIIDKKAEEEWARVIESVL